MSTKTETILIENAPQIPGLVFRSFRGEADYPVMAEIINAANLADQDDHVANLEEIASTYQYLQRSDPAKDMVFVEINGQPVGYGRCSWDQESKGDYLYISFLRLAPAGRSKGIGRLMMAYMARRLEIIAAEHPADAPKFFQTWSSTARPDWNEILEEMGYTPVRFMIGMMRPCSLPVTVVPLPERIEVRPVQDDHKRQIFEAEEEAFLDHWGNVEANETDYQRWLANPLNDPNLWKVAWEGDQVVGMVRNFVDMTENEALSRRRGYTEEISVRRPWRRMGVARALLTQSIQMFIEMSMEETFLTVDTQNPNGAHNLYYDVGYQEIKRHITYRKPFNWRRKL